VWSCYQEKPTRFRDYTLYDPGAYPEDAICRKITWRVTRPELETKDEQEKKQVKKFKDIMERKKKKTEERKNKER